jgi:hypothetical protein
MAVTNDGVRAQFLRSAGAADRLIYGTLSYRYRNKAATRVGEEITRERYRQNQS